MLAGGTWNVDLVEGIIRNPTQPPRNRELLSERIFGAERMKHSQNSILFGFTYDILHRSFYSTSGISSRLPTCSKLVVKHRRRWLLLFSSGAQLAPHRSWLQDPSLPFISMDTPSPECTVKVQATCLTEWTCATARLETGVTEIGKAPQSNYPERKIFPAALFTLTLTALAAARPLINSKRAPFTDVVPEVVDDDNGSSWSWDTSKHAGGCRLGNCYITSKSANRALNADFDRECTVGHCPHLEVPTVKAVRSTEQDWLQNSWSDCTKLMRVDKLSNEELIPAFHGFVGWKSRDA
ncbi:hypothetical protein C8J57DRAFT_1240737 [Mycena rebaudengoi]|nr:hypothetical protein C8J57DRAFT_1240737 [Mycena rebaudengoi]